MDAQRDKPRKDLWHSAPLRRDFLFLTCEVMELRLKTRIDEGHECDVGHAIR